MDDPCNVDQSVQPWIIPQVLKEASPPRYPFKLVSSRTEWDEIETVVGFIRELRGVERVSLVGWSTGAPRAGGFAALHPEAVDKLVLFGPSPYFPNDDPPATIPEPGAPMILQSWDMLMNRRWQADVRCDGQIEDTDIREVMWRELMAVDGLGATWSKDGRGVMRAPNRMNFGWRANVANIRAPTLILVGEFDNYERRRDAWLGLRVEHKAFIKVACASHFMQYERGRHLLHRATCEWLASGTIEGKTCAELCAGPDGGLQPLA
jgi:pimeloyl-ACP methyl ester carboxylesterase